MMEDPSTISSALDALWIAKAIERIGDHAKNIAEHTILYRRRSRYSSPDCRKNKEPFKNNSLIKLQFSL